MRGPDPFVLSGEPPVFGNAQLAVPNLGQLADRLGGLIARDAPEVVAAGTVCVFRGNWTAVPEQTDRAFRSKLVNPRSEATQDADYVLS